MVGMEDVNSTKDERVEDYLKARAEDLLHTGTGFGILGSGIYLHESNILGHDLLTFAISFILCYYGVLKIASSVEREYYQNLEGKWFRKPFKYHF